jgi:hypothetical protein
MATASYSFEPGQTVWCIVSSPPFVQAAVVAKVTIQAVLPTVAPTVQYQVQYTGVPVSGSSVLSSNDLFGDVDSALTAYRIRITTP